MTTIDSLNNQTQTTTNAVGTYINADGTTTTENANDLSDKDSFLKLLVAQLKYQDPSSPTDTTELMSQTAQYSQVQSLQNLETEMGKMLNSSQSTTAATFIGKTITGTSTTSGSDVSGVVTSIVMGSDGPIVKIGDTEVEFDSVKEVSS